MSARQCIRPSSQAVQDKIQDMADVMFPRPNGNGNYQKMGAYIIDKFFEDYTWEVKTTLVLRRKRK